MYKDKGINQNQKQKDLILKIKSSYIYIDMSTEEPTTIITEEESKRMLDEFFKLDENGKFKIPTSNLSECGDFKIEENQTLNGLIEQLENSSARIGIALSVLLLSIQEVVRMIIQEKTEYMSIMDSESQESDSMRIAEIKMNISLYYLFISEGFNKFQLLVSSRTRIDYFYHKFTLVLNGLSEHFPGCGDETMSQLQEKMLDFGVSHPQIGSEQMGGQGQKMRKLFLAFIVALSLLVSSTTTEMDARKNATVIVANNFSSVDPNSDALLGGFDKMVAISNASVAFSSNTNMDKALEQIMAVEVTGAIKNSSDPNIKGIYGKSGDLRTAVVKIMHADKDSRAAVGAEYGLTSIDVANIVQLSNVVSNDGREIFIESVNEINKLSKKAFEETDKLITTITLTLKDMITSLSYLDVSNERDQEILFKINEAIEKFLIENGVGLGPRQALAPGSSQPIAPGGLSSKMATTDIEVSTVAPTSSVLTGFAKAYEYTAAVIGKDAAKAIANVVATPEFKGEVKGNAEARAQNKEKVKQEESKRVKLTEKAITAQQDIASRLTILAAMGRFEAMPVQFSYDSEKNEVTVNVTGNYRGEVLSSFKDNVVSPLLYKARQDAAADKKNYWSQLTESQRSFFKLAQSLEERLVIGGEALSMLNNAVFATAQKTDNPTSLLDITGRKMREAVELLLMAQKELPLTELKEKALLKIDKELAERAEEAAKQYWDGVNSKISNNLRGALEGVKAVTKEGWYGITAGFLGALAGISEATQDSYMEYPAITIIAVGFCGSLVFFLMSLATEMMGINALVRTTIKVSSSVLTSTPMAIILGSLVSLQVYQEFAARLPQLVGGPAVPGLTPQEMFFNNIVLYLFKISNIQGCNDGVCFSPPGKTEIIFMFGGFIAIVTWGITKTYKIVRGTPAVASPTTQVVAPQQPQGRRRRGGQKGGATTCAQGPFRKILFTGGPKQNPTPNSSHMDIDPSKVPLPDTDSDEDFGGSAKSHRTRRFTNKNRKMNKTKKPKSTLNKNKKAKYNSSKNKNKNKKNKNTNTRKHKRTIRRK